MIGEILFGIGSIIAICAAAKLPKLGETYPDTLGPFWVGIVLAIAGSIAWHLRVKKSIHAELNEHKKLGTSPADFLHRALIQAKELKKEIHHLSESQICKRTDLILENDIAPFVEFKQALINMYGMSHGVDILAKMAFGERMLNRVWSAASDKHKPEATSSLDEAIMAIESAVEHIDQLSR